MYPMDRRLVGTHSPSQNFGEEKISSSRWESNSGLSSPHPGEGWVLKMCLEMTVKVQVNQSRYRPLRGPEVSRKLRFPDFVTTAQDCGRLSTLCTGHLYAPGTHFCYRLSRSQEGFYVNEKSNDTSWERTSDP